jgi:hypothetical protein
MVNSGGILARRSGTTILEQPLDWLLVAAAQTAPGITSGLPTNQPEPPTGHFCWEAFSAIWSRRQQRRRWSGGSSSTSTLTDNAVVLRHSCASEPELPSAGVSS